VVGFIFFLFSVVLKSNVTLIFMNYAYFLLQKKEFPEIKHSFDVWHGANNFGKMMA
jgi:hypothetical protein